MGVGLQNRACRPLKNNKQLAWDGLDVSATKEGCASLLHTCNCDVLGSSLVGCVCMWQRVGVQPCVSLLCAVVAGSCVCMWQRVGLQGLAWSQVVILVVQAGSVEVTQSHVLVAVGT